MKGVTYTTCTSVGNGGTDWCETAGGLWGNCRHSCPGDFYRNGIKTSFSEGVPKPFCLFRRVASDNKIGEVKAACKKDELCSVFVGGG